MLLKRICGTVGPSLAASLELLTLYQNVASLSLFCRYYFGRCSSGLVQLAPRILEGVLLFILIDCMIFLSPARPWNFLPIECFPLTYDLSGFKSRINGHLLSLGSF